MCLHRASGKVKPARIEISLRRNDFNWNISTHTSSGILSRRQSVLIGGKMKNSLTGLQTWAPLSLSFASFRRCALYMPYPAPMTKNTTTASSWKWFYATCSVWARSQYPLHSQRAKELLTRNAHQTRFRTLAPTITENILWIGYCSSVLRSETIAPFCLVLWSIIAGNLLSVFHHTFAHLISCRNQCVKQ